MNRSDLRPGDVVFPLDPLGTPWVVVAWEEGRMMYLGSDGRPTWWSDEEDHTFHPQVLIVRGGEAVQGSFP